MGIKNILIQKLVLLKVLMKNFSFETKRNRITNSSEYYDLSYEYFNDCLKLD